MKLRILDDSLRLRLGRSEVTRLAQGEPVEGHTHFPSGVFTYRVTTTSEVRSAASFVDGCIEVCLPVADVQRWATTDEVSLRATQELAGGRSLRLLVEKDFQCLAPRDEAEDSDSFENPNAGATC
jgi:hypothetical protein